jgi:oligopeptide transport system permease protein
MTKPQTGRDWIQLLNKWLGPFVFAVFILTVIVSFLGYEIPNEMLWLNAALIVGFFAYYTITEGLAAYVFKRVVQTAFVLLVIATMTFGLLRIIPGGPFDQEKTLTPEIKAAIEAKYNLNAPLYVQYWDYLSGIAQGDLGQSYKYVGRNVSEMLAESFPSSFQLGIFSLLVAFLIGIPAGVFAASRHNTWKDSVTMILAVSSVSLPSFLVAALAITVFCFWMDLLPVALWDGPSYYILPVLVLGLRPAAIIARLTRASVLDVIRSDYIRTARAKGLSENVILYKHVLKNSLIPVLTFAGPLAAGILSGAFIIEHIFNIPGMGKHFIQSVTNRDYPLVLGVTLIFSFLLIISNLVVDILYTYFDPRIKLS